MVKSNVYDLLLGACCPFMDSAQTIALVLFPELRVLELLVLLEHFQHYSGQIRRDEEEDKNF